MGTNDDNTAYYEAIGPGRLAASAMTGGFDGGQDLLVACAHVSPDDAVLEIGAGYGRVLDLLVANGHRGPILAIEKSAALHAFLTTKFAGSSERLTIVQADIRRLEVERPVDVALWMWSGFADFSPEEQMEACARLHRITSEHGKVLIDVPRPGTRTVAEHLDAKHVKKETAFGTLSAYLPDDDDLRQIRDACGYARLVRTDYETATGRSRTLYRLEK